MCEKLKFIANEIDKLSGVEYQEIFRIVHANNYSYTRNNNGIFINISKLNMNDIEQLYNYISFCKESKKNIVDFENIKSDLMKNRIDGIKETCDSDIDKIEKVDDSEQVNKIGSNSTLKNKVSTTMKFYILKKKMLRNQSTINYMIPNNLAKDEPLVI